MQTLFASDYACTEDIARAIQPHASSATITALLTLIASNENDLARRNAVRVLGRLAERAVSPSARELVTQIRADAVRATLQARLQNDRNNYLLQDVLWIFDTFFFPAIAVQADLERISADLELDPTLRARAIRAAGRLIASKNGRLPPEDLAFTLSSLHSDSVGVRAEAALIAAQFRDSQLDNPMRYSLIAALEMAWQRDSPLCLPIDDPAPPIQPGHYDSASIAAPLTALVAVARALDRYEETTRRFEQLRSEYEALSLTSTLQADRITIRAGLPADELPALIQRMEQQSAVFFDLLGPWFTTPVPDDSNETLTAVISPTRAVYREYMGAFVGLRPDVDGVYVETQATLYTFQRTAAQSANSLEESLQHEYAHYLAGRYLFPEAWHDPNYHAEPKGWADEGLAEFFAGLVFERDSGYTAPRRQKQLEVICARPEYRRLEALLAQREGYDSFGSFDYEHAWAFTYYLLTEQRDVALRLYTAYRAKTYQMANVASIAGVDSVAALEADWHAAMERWRQSAARR
ncbi:MAG: collagenase [Chloroflexales bacterium]|nr:collagenase [Chloroflexales bacterium]